MPTRDAVPTFGTVFANSAIDLVAGPKLVYVNGREIVYGKKVSCAHSRFTVGLLPPSVWQAVALPKSVGRTQPIADLFQNIHQHFHAVGFDEQTSASLTYFVIATWFSAHLFWVPSLIVSGSIFAAIPMLQLLASLCRRSIFVTDVFPSALRELCIGLKPTLIIAQSKIGTRLRTFLEGASFSELQTLHGSQLINTGAPKVLFSDNVSKDGWLAQTSLRLRAPNAIQIISSNQLRRIEDQLQPQLLRYFLDNVHAVRGSNFDVPEFTEPARQFARSFGACIVGDCRLQRQVASILEGANEELLADRTDHVSSVLVEALLSYCHDGHRRAVKVQELRHTVTAIFAGREREVGVTDRFLGERIRDLGLKTTRLAGGIGRGVLLADETRRKIHRLASDLQIPDSLVATSNCNLCSTAQDRTN